MNIFKKTLFLLGLAFVAACGSTQDQTPTQDDASIPITAVLPLTVSSLTLTVTGDDIKTPFVFNFTPDSTGVAKGMISVPVGKNRVFTGEAKNSDNLVTHRGSVTANITSGTNPTLQLKLDPVTADVEIVITIG